MTVFLIALDVVVFLLELTRAGEGLEAFALWPPRAFSADSPGFHLWQLVTYSTMHASFAQFAILWWLMRGAAYPTIGASAGVFGVLVTYALLFPKRRVVMLFPPCRCPPGSSPLATRRSNSCSASAATPPRSRILRTSGAWRLRRRSSVMLRMRDRDDQAGIMQPSAGFGPAPHAVDRCQAAIGGSTKNDFSIRGYDMGPIFLRSLQHRNRSNQASLQFLMSGAEPGRSHVQAIEGWRARGRLGEPTSHGI